MCETEEENQVILRACSFKHDTYNAGARFEYVLKPRDMCAFFHIFYTQFRPHAILSPCDLITIFFSASFEYICIAMPETELFTYSLNIISSMPYF